MKVYVAAPVRGQDAPEGSLEAILDGLTLSGHEPVNTLPPTAAPATMPAQETRVFIAETDRMMGADLLVAEVTAPSLGVGWTIAWFLAKGRLVVLCCRRDRKGHLSMLLGGNPSPWQRLLLYDDPDDLRAQLAKTLGR